MLPSQASRLAAPNAARLTNAFDPQFLEQIDGCEEPGSSHQAETDGPWVVHGCRWHGKPGWGVFRSWESPGCDPPRAWSTEVEVALLTAVVLPATGEDRWYSLDTESEPAGHPLRDSAGHPVGYLPLFDEPLVLALHVCESLIRSPVRLAMMLRAAGPQALALIGSFLARDLESSPPAPQDE